MTVIELNGHTFYLIPDGFGNWKKTDPRIDRDRTREINQKHNGNVLNIIRVIKYWNRRSTMPSIPSYLLETMILDYYADHSNIASQFVDVEIPYVLEYLSAQVFYKVNDPKRIQENINNLSWEEQTKLSNRGNLDKQKANEARSLEINDDHKGSIRKWGEIFGGEFPTYV